MRTLLGWFHTAATRAPRLVVTALVLVTVAMGALASTLYLEVDLTQLGREGAPAIEAMDRVREEFADPSASVQVMVDRGPGANILDEQGLAAVQAVTTEVADALGDDARRDQDGRPLLVSIAALGPDHPQAAGLLSDDADPAAGTARATVVVAMLDPDLDEGARAEAALRVDDALAAATLPGDVDVTVTSTGLLTAGLVDEIRAEVPLLFGLALLVVLLILALTYRSAADVGVGLAGMLMTVVWTFGLIALLGPNWLGVTGPMSQLGVIVPVLLVGLGIDFAVHLTARYREQAAAGQPPEAAVGRALHTVGAALVLAAVATALGFAATATAPLPILADFGIFVAAGVLIAFLVMALLVPAVQVLRGRRARSRRRGLRGGRGEPAAVREVSMGPLLAVPLALARRAPAAGLLVAVVLVAGALWAATGLEIRFDRDDFIPEGSEVAAVLDRQRALFGASLTETTFVVVEGDLTDPAVANAMVVAEEQLATVDSVRRVNGQPQTRSIVTAALPALGTDRFPPEADLATVYDRVRDMVGEVQARQLITDDDRAAVVQIRTTAGDAGAAALEAAVRDAFAPVRDAGASVQITSEPLIIREMSQDLSTFQARSIVIALTTVLLLLTLYYGLAHRRWLLGLLAMIPAVVSATLTLGAMRLLGFDFNVLTAMLTAIAIGIGVPYGIHVVNRFVEELDPARAAADAVPGTLRGTGAALTGSALTTLGAFVVLSFSGLGPIQALGLLGGIAIAAALLAALLVEPGALVLWAGRRQRHARARSVAAQTSR